MQRRMMTIHSVRNDFSYAGTSDWLDWWRAYEYLDHLVFISFGEYFDVRNYDHCSELCKSIWLANMFKLHYYRVSLWSQQDCGGKEKQLRILMAMKGTTDVIHHLTKQECFPVGCVPAAHWPYAGVCLSGGCLLQGGLLLGGQGGASFLGGCLLPGDLLLVGVSLGGCASFLGGLLGGRFTFLGGSPSGGLLLGGSPGGPPSGGLPPSWGVSWGASFQGGLLGFLGGPPFGGCLLPRGSPSWGRVPPSWGASFRETPPVNRMTDTSKNITLATTLLRPGNNGKEYPVQDNNLIQFS